MEISWQIRSAPGDAWGVGLMTMTDRTANGILTSNYVAISTSYQKALDENGWNQIGIGFQGSYANKRLDGTKLNFEDQLDQQGGWTLTQFRSWSAVIRLISVISTSIWVFCITDLPMEITTIILAHRPIIFCSPLNHLPVIQFIHFHPRFTLHGGYSFPLSQSNNNNFIHFSGMYSRQSNAVDAMLGGAWSYNLNSDEPASPSDQSLSGYLGPVQ